MLASLSSGQVWMREVRLGEQEHACHGAVRKGIEPLADDGRAAGLGGGVEDGPQLIRIGQDRRVAHPRVHRVEPHRLSCVRGP